MSRNQHADKSSYVVSKQGATASETKQPLEKKVQRMAQRKEMSNQSRDTSSAFKHDLFPLLRSVEARLHFCSTATSSFRRHGEVLVVIFHRIKNQKFQVADKTVSKTEHEY